MSPDLKIPRRLVETLDGPDFDPTAEIIRWLTYDVNEGRLKTLALAGNAGVGKSTTAAWALRRLTRDMGDDRRLTGIWLPVSSISTMQHWSGEGAAELKRLLRVAVLVMDDVGRERDTPTIKEAVDLLIRERHDASLMTLMTTTLTAQEFKRRYGDGAARRMESFRTYLEPTWTETTGTST